MPTPKLTKDDIISEIANAYGTPKQSVRATVDAVFDLISQAVQLEQKVVISQFGTFELRERAARKSRNPRTGEPVYVDASKTMVFKAAPAIKRILNG